MLLCPEEEKMLEKLKATESKIPIQIRKVGSNIFFLCFFIMIELCQHTKNIVL
jgi:hypothetical protein